MTAPRSKFPLASFGPELMTALIRGGQSIVIINFPNRTKAKAFQARIHLLRSRMSAEQHPHYHIAAKAKVSLYWGIRLDLPDDLEGKTAARIIISPRDSEFIDNLKDAGLMVSPIEEDELEPDPVGYSDSPTESIDRYLEDMK